MNDNNRFQFFNRIIIYAALVAGILFLRLIADYPSGIVNFSEGIVIIAERIVIALGLEEIVLTLGKFPGMALIFVSGIFQVVIGLILLFIFKNKAEQGTMIIIKKPVKVIGFGNVIYILALALFFLFTISVVGIPVALIIGTIIYIISFIGSVPLAIFFGYNICQALNVSGYTYIYYMMGSFFMVLCKSIYAVGGAFTFYIFPVLSIGIVAIMILNRFIFKMSYKIEFPTKRDNERFDRKKIKDIITKGL
ncbi:hypothetical protein B5E58_05840 [Tyzzerella sp. An114]|uniref:hypothetical protein n=1 Tax=Tyzzerella sp. An114 TaxID=1965545 RepID=UPI000B437998|nr:hypothetical protein [Tyzzerella sp. An114]OUQ58704.1 hypothetical protein B5E58_05840 [Tyzzerella sp. An114]